MAESNIEEILAEPEEILAEPDAENLSSQHEETTSIFDSVSGFLSSYGWFLIIGIGIAFYMWQKYVKTELVKWKRKRDADRESAEYHKNPDLAVARIQAMELARQRMQAAHDAAAIKHLETCKQKEEEKRLEKIKEWEKHEKGLGYRNKTRVEEKNTVGQTTSSKPKAKARLRDNDYNPLSGSGGSGYRSGRRCGGGGSSGG